MAAHAQPTQDVDDEQEYLEEQYLEADEVLEEIPVEEHHMMEEDDDELPDGDAADDEGIVWEDSSIQHFPTHGKSVFSLSTHPSAPLVCSGGEDDLGYIWNIEDGNELVRLSGHMDSVVSTAFSTSGEFVATGGMDGKIRIWRKVANSDNWKDWEFITELQGPDEVVWMQWHPKGNVLLAGSNDSTAWLWQLPSGNTMHVLAGHSGAVNTGMFTPDGKRIITGCQEGTLILWDPKEGQPVVKLTSKDERFGMSEGITSIGVNAASSLAVVGGANGAVRLINLVNGTILEALESHKEGDSVESTIFVDPGTGTAGLAVTGGTDGKICVWDVSTMRLRVSMEHSDPVTKLLAHPAPQAHLVTSASADRTLRTWDLRNGSLVSEHKGHQGVILDAALSTLDSTTKIVSAGDDGVCLVFAVN